MVVDPIKQGLSRGWTVIDGTRITESKTLEADVVIVGSGAGGGVTAEVLSDAGLRVIIVEMGSLRSSSNFDMEERSAYPFLYQESAARKTKDKAIGVLQGRTVGGSTTVNWTTSIRTPENTQQFWQDKFGVKLTGDDTLTPWFEKAEKRLNIHKWPVPPNRNNQALKDGCEKLGWDYTIINRNVNGCANLGYCGMGCPINAKQSMLVTTIPTAMDNGATLLNNVLVQKLEIRDDKVQSVQAIPLDENFIRRTDVTLTLKARHYVLSAGAIGTPAILKRSGAPDRSGRTGKHTFLHPTVITGALMDQQIDGHAGAPQSVYSDEFLWRNGVDGPAGYKLEVPPVHPVLIGSKLMGYGETHAELMQQMNNVQIMLALIRDGFHEDSPGGTVEINKYGDPVLDYPVNDFLLNAIKRAWATMIELQFAIGAKAAFPTHDDARLYTSWKQAKKALDELSYEKYKVTIASAHVMGGCNMGESELTSVVSSYGQHHQVENLSVHDGSVFPTSLGANPQLSIYGLIYRNATALASRLKTS